MEKISVFCQGRTSYLASLNLMKQSMGLSSPTMLNVIDEAVGLTRQGEVRRRREFFNAEVTFFPFASDVPGSIAVPAPSAATRLINLLLEILLIFLLFYLHIFFHSLVPDWVAPSRSTLGFHASLMSSAIWP